MFETLIDAICHHRMYDSLACWKTPFMVDLRHMITSNTSNLNALRENIWIHVLDLRWHNLDISWYKYEKYLSMI